MRLFVSVAVIAIVLAMGCRIRADESRTLPAPYAHYSQVEVLKLIFPSYDAREQTISELKNEDQIVARVEWAGGRTWNINGQKLLAVVSSVSVYQGSLCGICPRRFHIALLKKINGRLQVIASGISPVYGGHRDAVLDLAPYRLSEREMLLGLRIQHVWWMTNRFDEVLELYRVMKPHIDLVFRTLAIDRQYQHNMNDPVLSKRVTTVAIDESKPFNDLRVVQQVYRCRNEFAGSGSTRFATGDCDVAAKSSDLVWTDGSYWKFDGRRFIEKIEWEQDLYSGGN